jgi:prepilin-type N-terminal cleavage/methylation domain
MKRYEHRTGLTLVEMLIVIAIIAILAVMVISVATRIENRAKEQLTESTIALLNDALTQFNDYGYQYKNAYAEFKFPLDCTGFSQADLKTTLENALGATTVAIVGVNDPNYSGSEVLYFFLSQVPESRQTLDKIDKALITNKTGKNGSAMILTIDSTSYSLYGIIDPWKTPLRYDYYYEGAPTVADMVKTKRAFPVLTSAGSDRTFGTNDDIKSR